MLKFSKIIFSIIIISLLTIKTYALAPYNNYTFTPAREKVSEPQAVRPIRTITGKDMKIGDLKNPTDIYFLNDKCYIVDRGNSRLLVTNKNFEIIKEIKSFINNGKKDTFNNPNGVFVTQTGVIYLCDTENNRIVVLDKDYNLVKLITKPQTNLLTDKDVFKPLMVAVDKASRVFIVAKDINLGMIELDKDGKFQSFFGPLKVQPNWWQMFVKSFATQAQKDQMAVTVPTEYSSVDIDSSGFVYGTVSVFDRKNFNETIFIHKLNPMGNDILIRNGYAPPMGDVDYTYDPKTNVPLTSKLVDIKVSDNGIYSVLDQEKGRVFTYNKQGYLLYVFGAMGDCLGQFANPVSVEANSDNYYVIDKERNWIVEFGLTDYGKTVKDAVVSLNKLEYEQANSYWNKTLKNSAKSFFAYNQIGISALKNGQNEKAIKYLNISNDKKNYSYAFGQIRNEWLSNNFNYIFGTIIVIALFIIALKIHKNRRKKSKK